MRCLSIQITELPLGISSATLAWFSHTSCHVNWKIFNLHVRIISLTLSWTLFIIMQMVQHKGETSHSINFKSSVFKIKKMTMTKLADDLPSTNNAKKCMLSLFSNWRHLFYCRYYLVTLQMQRRWMAIHYTTQLMFCLTSDQVFFLASPQGQSAWLAVKRKHFIFQNKPITSSRAGSLPACFCEL